MQGPPCSGKSTWANKFKELFPECVIVNRDSIRLSVGNGKYTHNKEDEVSEIERDMVVNAMIDNVEFIISDNTNLNPKYLPKWYDLASKYGYEVVEKEFYISFGEAMKRSKKRKEDGGLYISSSVMESFYKRYYKEKLEEEMTDYRINNSDKFNDELPNCVICDLDGTFAMHTGRTPFEWERLDEDVADERLHKILNVLCAFGVNVFFLTGRTDEVREQTDRWIRKNFGSHYKLIMRDRNDWSSGEVCKKKLYEENIKGKYNVICSFEDSNKCVEMWRNEGLLTLQVQNGDY